MEGSEDLISFVASLTGEGNLRVEENLGSGFVRLRISEAERRQAKHDIRHVEDIVIEMLRNARDAGASRIYIATAKEEHLRTLIFLDNGSGIPSSMAERIFDARVTSKLESMKMDEWGVHGRGMALFSIKQNVQEARLMASGEHQGSSFKILVDTEALHERADQSSWPAVEKDDEGVAHCVRGPKNIIRSSCEFALANQRSCEVYIGTPTEVAATLMAHAAEHLDAERLLFIECVGELPVVDRLGAAADAADLLSIAQGLGIEISERTAHRILSGQIKPLRGVAARLLRQRQPDATPRRLDLSRDRRGLKIDQDDLDAFSRAVESSFSDLAARYYIRLTDTPRIRVRRDRITISFDIAQDE
ncbi:ATP-binding protein [Collinsella sp. AGMB00827]|uniref:ATP-binding protein n=1 Tax=Collinsella ureilytica TaxID=2869515 RepID=A0ABS7MLP4_9ACTN|nr:ATP-binding protein [Collinsella urealyticum]MBY4797991.1 ATP-binding protein [Collinsella urealyticum]